jgi:hypothetical protein
MTVTMEHGFSKLNYAGVWLPLNKYYIILSYSNNMIVFFFIRGDNYETWC